MSHSNKKCPFCDNILAVESYAERSYYRCFSQPCYSIHDFIKYYAAYTNDKITAQEYTFGQLYIAVYEGNTIIYTIEENLNLINKIEISRALWLSRENRTEVLDKLKLMITFS